LPGQLHSGLFRRRGYGELYVQMADISASNLRKHRRSAVADR
jgi:hypothetical protein